MRSRFLFSCYYLQSSLDDTVSVYVGIFLSSLSISHSCSCYMESIEWTQTIRGAKAFIYKNQKYRKRCSNKDGSEIWICCNKFCVVSIVLLDNTIKRYPQEHLHEELQHTSEIRTLVENIYKETTDDLLKPVTEIYQQHLIQHVFFYKFFKSFFVFYRFILEKKVWIS